MRIFVDAQIHAPSKVRPRRASRTINPLVTWAAMAFLGFLASIAGAVPSFAQIVGTVHLNIERRAHTATLLEDGKVLIVGGDNQSGIVNQVELLDPASQTSSLAAMPIVARTDHTATRLADGRVLIIGGRDQHGSLTSTEIYNPLTATFTAGPSLTTPRIGHTATLLTDDKILVAGGDAGGSAELYNPATQNFSLVTGGMNTPRQYHSAVLLNSGKVLIVGGVVGTNTTLTSAEIYDPQAQTFTPASGPMQTPRGLALLRVLPDGKVQVIGGDGEFSMEMFDPATKSFIALAHIPPHQEYLNNILVSRTRSALITTIIQQNPVLQGQPELTADITALLNRLDHTVTEIPQSNQALIVGGINDAGQILSSATMVSSSAATITTDRFDYPPGQTVTITGQGWQPNETVWMLFHEEPETHTDVVISSVADSQGDFTNTDFAPAPNDLNRNFTLTAIGQSSGFTTQTAFKDAKPNTVTVTGQNPNPVPAGASATFTVTVSFNGNANSCTADLSISGLPAGASLVSFSTNPVTSTGADQTSTLTINTTPSLVASTYSFTVTAAGRTGCQNPPSASGNGSLVVTAPAATTMSVAAASGTYGGTVNLSATLTKTSGGTAVSGQTIAFTLNGNGVGNAITNGSGVATLSNISLLGINAGTFTGGVNSGVGASFAAAAGFASSSGTATLTVATKNATWTTNPNSKTYGDADPNPLTTGSGTGFLAGDNVTATYSRAAGETVAGNPYHVTATLSPAGVLGNYNITNAGADFTINKRNATWSTNPNSKTYGDADPNPLTTGSGSNFVVADNVTATYSRLAGETVAGGPYHITATLSPAGVLGNYNITNAGANFTINAKAASVTPNAASKTYGDADPTFTGTLSGFVPADGVTATYSRTVGETVAGSPYIISATLSPAGVLGNYTITYNTANFSINKKDATWMTNPASKTYGDADPAPLTTGSGSGFLAGDNVTATYSRAVGETVAGNPYHITATLSPAGVLGNYNITNAGADFTINKRNATWTTIGASKTYGDSDPSPLTTGSGTGFLAADNVTATYSRAAGETVAGNPYHITATLSPAGVLGNYNITNAGADFTINKRTASVTPDAKTKTYGSTDPTLTGSLTGFLAADNVTATYSRTAGETVPGSPYTISATLSPAGVLGNYDITYNTAAFTITKADPIVTATGNTCTYNGGPCAGSGSAKGVLGENLTPVTVAYRDTLNNLLTSAPVSAGTYTVAARYAGDANYNQKQSAPATITINKQPATVTPNAASKIYGQVDPALTGTLLGFVASDGVTATYNRTGGENAGTYTISATLSPTGVLGNYDITYNTAAFTITKADPIVTATGNTCTYNGGPCAGSGSAKGVLGEDLTPVTVAYKDALNNLLTSAPVSAGTYTVAARYAGDANYNAKQSAPATITINKQVASVTPDAKSKVYGSADPALTGTLSGFLMADGVTANYSRTAGENVGSYTISATLSPAGVLGNYDITYNTAAFTITKADPIVTAVGNTCTYNGNPCLGSGSAIGVHGEILAPVTVAYSDAPGHLLASAPVAAGTYSVAARYAGDANYNAKQSLAALITINKQLASVTPEPKSKIFGSADPMLTGTLSGFLIADGVTASYSRAAGEDAGTYTISATLSPAGVLGNYDIAYNTANFTIGQATPTVSVTGGTFIDDAQQHAATGSVYGVGGPSDMLTPAVTFSYAGTGTTTYGPTSDAPSTPGTYLATATFAGNTNYTSASNTASITINNAAPQAQDQSVATNEDVQLPIMLRARDLDSSSLSFIITSGPSRGSLTPDPNTTPITTVCTSVPVAPGAMSCTGTITYSPNQNYNGSDSFKFKVNDGALDSNEATVTITVYPVNDAPTANAQSVTTDDLTPLAITLTGTDIETTDPANLTFAIVDAPMNGALSGTPPNVTYTPNLNYKGPDSFTFTVTDRGDPDNCGAPSQTCADVKTSPKAIVSITVTDGSPPMTLITDLKPASLSNDRNPSFGFSGTDNVTDPSALSFECKLDYDSWMECGTSGNPTTSYSNLGDGPHTFLVRATDGAGNVDPNPANYTWIIDATPPDTVMDSQPAALVSSSTATFTYHSTENGSTLWCSLDGAAAVDCTSSGTKTYTSLVDGQHTFSVAAKDQAGNVDPTAATVTWMIDTTAPLTTIISGPSSPTTNTSATFVFSSANSPGDSYQCRLDGSPVNFAPCTSPATYSGLSVGTHTFEVRGKDMAGNMETSPATYSWTIGQITLDQYAIDSDFKRFDGFDVVFGKGSGSSLKINSTNPDSFHYQIKLTNNTGVPISATNGNMATAIITVPGMPSSCGGVPCSMQIGSLADPAFVLKRGKVAHVWPGYHDRDGDDDDDDMTVSVKYMTLAQYQANGNSCADNSLYGATMPSNGAAKCIKITGFSIPVKHVARIRLNFQFRLKGTDGWNANSQQLFYSGFVFRATTSVNFGSAVQTASDATGLIGAGKKATAIGGYVFSGITPGMGNKVRLFTKKSDASCTVNTKLVAQAEVDANGFYYIWRAGMNQQNSNANSLPSGVQYAVQLCDGSSQNQLGLTSIDSRLRDQEFEQMDFDLP